MEMDSNPKKSFMQWFGSAFGGCLGAFGAIGVLLLIGIAMCTNSVQNNQMTDNSSPPAQSDSSQSSNNPSNADGLDPDQIIKAHAPQAELDLADAYSTYEKKIDAPNSIVRSEIEQKKAAAWRNTVLGIGNFNGWSAEVTDINESSDGSNRAIALHLVGGLKVWANVPLGSDLFRTLRNLSDNKEPIYISGRLTDNSLATLQERDSTLYATCFDGLYGLMGCEIELTSIQPIQ